MKSIYAIFFSVFMSVLLQGQSLTSIVPDNGEQGQTVIATISATGTNFTQDNWEASILSANDMNEAVNVTVINDQTLEAEFQLRANQEVAMYDLFVANAMFTALYDMPNAFEVTSGGGGSGTLVSITPNSGEQGSFVSTTIKGDNTQFTQYPGYMAVLDMGANDYSEAVSVTVIDDETIQADFQLQTNLTPGMYDLFMADSAVNQIYDLFSSFEVLPASSGQGDLVSIDPDTAQVGETLTLTVSGSNTSFTVGTNSVHLEQGSTIIIPNYHHATDNETIEAEFTFNQNHPLGFYDVVYHDSAGMLSLDDGFELKENPDMGPPQITSISPKAAEQGEIFTMTVNGSNTSFTNYSMMDISIVNNDAFYSETANTGTLNIIDDETLEVEFDIANNAEIGYYDLVITTMHHLFELEDGFEVRIPADEMIELDEVTPASAKQGESKTLNLIGLNTDFSSAYEYTARLEREDHEIKADSVKVVDSLTVEAYFTFATDDQTGDYDVFLVEDMQNLYGKKEAFKLEEGTSSVADQAIDELDITVYPNPASTGFFTVQKNADEHFNAKLLDLQGRLITQKRMNKGERQVEFHIDNLSAGTYLLMIENELNRTVKKVIVK